MAFQRIKPHHVQHPELGWLTEEHLADYPSLLEHLNAAGFVGGPPPAPSHPHHVEIDVSTGLVGYEALSAEEAKARADESAKLSKAQAKVEADERRRRDDVLDLVRTKAREDPAFAALAQLLGIPVE